MAAPPPLELTAHSPRVPVHLDDVANYIEQARATDGGLADIAEFGVVALRECIGGRFREPGDEVADGAGDHHGGVDFGDWVKHFLGERVGAVGGELGDAREVGDFGDSRFDGGGHFSIGGTIGLLQCSKGVDDGRSKEDGEEKNERGVGTHHDGDIKVLG